MRILSAVAGFFLEDKLTDVHTERCEEKEREPDGQRDRLLDNRQNKA